MRTAQPKKQQIVFARLKQNEKRKKEDDKSRDKKELTEKRTKKNIIQTHALLLSMHACVAV